MDVSGRSGPHTPGLADCNSALCNSAVCNSALYNFDLNLYLKGLGPLASNSSSGSGVWAPVFTCSVPGSARVGGQTWGEVYPPSPTRCPTPQGGKRLLVAAFFVGIAAAVEVRRTVLVRLVDLVEGTRHGLDRGTLDDP